MRTIIEHIDARNWRTLDYYRLLENQQKSNHRLSAATSVEICLFI